MSRIERFVCNFGKPPRSPRPVSNSALHTMFNMCCLYRDTPWLNKLTLGFQVYLAEVNLMNQLDPLVAEKIDFGQEGPTPNPYTIPSETRMSRMYSVSTSDMNYEFWTCEWMIPYNDKSCIVEDRQLVRIRHVANVSHLINVITSEILIICIKDHELFL